MNPRPPDPEAQKKEPARRTAALRVGLTGGIASGKSAAADAFRDLGVPVIDTDVVAREVVAPGTAGLAELVAAFGPEILDAHGALDRRRLRRRVFENAEDRRLLETLLHPRIRARTLAAADAADGPYVVLVVPLLVETGFDALVWRVVAVDVPETVQLERLMQRDGETPDQARRALAAQSPREARLQAADHILDNSRDLDHLRRQVQALHRELLRAADRNE